jgi:hypothetical protein
MSKAILTAPTRRCRSQVALPPPCPPVEREETDLDEFRPNYTPGTMPLRKAWKRFGMRVFASLRSVANHVSKELLIELEARKWLPLADVPYYQYTWAEDEQRETCQQYMDDLYAIDGSLLSRWNDSWEKAESEAKLYAKSFVPLHLRSRCYKKFIRQSPKHQIYIQAAKGGRYVLYVGKGNAITWSSSTRQACGTST